jgi:DNA-nicking Smr family endonuclease
VYDESEEPEIPEVVGLPIDGVLDLHTFRPAEVKYLIPDYLAECRQRGILDVRIIHGKGTGVLQRSVHAILARLSEVITFRLAGEEAGGWGATLVRLRPPEKKGGH